MLTVLSRNVQTIALLRSRGLRVQSIKRANSPLRNLTSTLRTLTAAGLVLALGLSAPICSAATLKKTSPDHRVQIGNASWYGVRQAGHRTASGEPYDPRSLTAAHPWLPLHSTVRVTNLNNGLWVDVRVNDRGPYNRHRVIDLSQKAAEMIGIKRRGVGRVKIEIAPVLQPVAYHRAD